MRTGSAGQGVRSPAEALGQQAEQLRGQVDEFLRRSAPPDGGGVTTPKIRRVAAPDLYAQEHIAAHGGQQRAEQHADALARAPPGR